MLFAFTLLRRNPRTTQISDRAARLHARGRHDWDWNLFFNHILLLDPGKVPGISDSASAPRIKMSKRGYDFADIKRQIIAMAIHFDPCVFLGSCSITYAPFNLAGKLLEGMILCIKELVSILVWRDACDHVTTVSSRWDINNNDGIVRYKSTIGKFTSLDFALLSSNDAYLQHVSPDRTANTIGINHHAIIGSTFAATVSPLLTTTRRWVQMLLDHISDAR